MKKLILAIAITILFILSGCNPYQDRQRDDKGIKTPGFTELTIDSCEYILFTDINFEASTAIAVTHKGNCKNHKNK